MAALAASWHHVVQATNAFMRWDAVVCPRATFTLPLLVRAVAARGAGQKETRGRGKTPYASAPGRGRAQLFAQVRCIACLAHSPGRMQGAGHRLESPCKVRFCRGTNCTERICTAPVVHRPACLPWAECRIKIRWRKNGCAHMA